jgi:hypothetical protein
LEKPNAAENTAAAISTIIVPDGTSAAKLRYMPTSPHKIKILPAY